MECYFFCHSTLALIFFKTERETERQRDRERERERERHRERETQRERQRERERERERVTDNRFWSDRKTVTINEVCC